jgi:hypothetical protein
MAQRLLEGVEGEYLPEESGDLEELRERVSQLEDDLRREKAARLKAENENRSLIAAMEKLRQMLSPFHRLLRGVFGEIEVVIGPESAESRSPFPSASPSNANDPRWESYKQTFPGVAAQIIDALLSHQQMTYGQLKTLLRRDYNTIKNAAAKLRQAGAIIKEGTMCRLNR